MIVAGENHPRTSKTFAISEARALFVTMPGGGDITFVEQHAEQLIDYKKELASIYEELVSLDLDEDDLFFLHARLEKLHFA